MVNGKVSSLSIHVKESYAFGSENKEEADKSATLKLRSISLLHTFQAQRRPRWAYTRKKLHSLLIELQFQSSSWRVIQSDIYCKPDPAITLSAVATVTGGGKILSKSNPAL